MLRDEIDALLKSIITSTEGVSDLLFVSGRPPMVERHGKIIALEGHPAALSSLDIEGIAGHFINGNERLISDFQKGGSCDCSYSVPNLARFRVNIYRQNGNWAIVMRKLQSEIPNRETLGLPPIFQEIIKEKNGVIFVTGGTGSGKTTTLAAMLNELNRTQEIHIVTLEDPIEFVHPHQRAVFSQRELGKDFPDFATGLRAAMRQAPKVILVGEIRDRETMEIALTASETGHVVYSTLHTINAGQTVNRILGMFGKDEEKQVRERLTATLQYIVSQRLVPRIGGGRIAVQEIMGSNMRTRETLLYGENDTRNYTEIIEASSPSGWQSFDQALLMRFEDGSISEETAMIFCTHKNKMRRDLDMAKKLRGLDSDIPSGLRLAPAPPPDRPTRVATAA